MKSLSVLVLLVGWSAGRVLASPPQTESPSHEEVVTAREELPPGTQLAPAGEGFMEPQQVRDLLQKLYRVEFRINDLFSEVRPDQWKMQDSARNSFTESFKNLRVQMEALEGWRSQMEGRPDSMYVGYMLHASIDAILPRLDGVTRIITQRENSSLGAQFSQAQGQLFDLQQSLQPYLVYLLRNQDQVLYAAQTNLAGCETRLGTAMAGQREPAKVMKNIVPDFKGRRKPKPPAAPPVPK